ncbi:hypothetical protein PRIPAC_85998 [Pristionchus pacificus]|uniref:Uncharacterized protein n=1 Tax=Pristionchus pacificus TaxID=54126 RepID=A0A2A6BP75_PRIPA|nr:hypothetical protein PRIPAC_85998 [Pristionchus pacificus]|eukprot:PDM67583.1 hypothetical protein PRIPAC_49000 [Pristionchus pacificus]
MWLSLAALLASVAHATATEGSGMCPRCYISVADHLQIKDIDAVILFNQGQEPVTLEEVIQSGGASPVSRLRCSTTEKTCGDAPSSGGDGSNHQGGLRDKLTELAEKLGSTSGARLDGTRHGRYGGTNGAQVNGNKSTISFSLYYENGSAFSPCFCFDPSSGPFPGSGSAPSGHGHGSGSDPSGHGHGCDYGFAPCGHDHDYGSDPSCCLYRGPGSGSGLVGLCPGHGSGCAPCDHGSGSDLVCLSCGHGCDCAPYGHGSGFSPSGLYPGSGSGPSGLYPGSGSGPSCPGHGCDCGPSSDRVHSTWSVT